MMFSVAGKQEGQGHKDANMLFEMDGGHEVLSGGDKEALKAGKKFGRRRRRSVTGHTSHSGRTSHTKCDRRLSHLLQV